MTQRDIHDYDDIINLPHPTSRRHPRMSMENRAGQFSPFAPLTAHTAAIKETARVTDQQLELDENMKEKLDQQLQMLYEGIGSDRKVSITYFVPDEKKDGGRYRKCTGTVKKMDMYNHLIIMKDGLHVPIEKISCIEFADNND